MRNTIFILFVLLIDSRDSLPCIEVQGPTYQVLKNAPKNTFQFQAVFNNAAIRSSSTHQPFASSNYTALFSAPLRGGVGESKKTELDDDEALAAEYDDLVKVQRAAQPSIHTPHKLSQSDLRPCMRQLFRFLRQQ